MPRLSLSRLLFAVIVVTLVASVRTEGRHLRDSSINAVPRLLFLQPSLVKATSTEGVGGGFAIEAAALKALYAATNGPQWKSRNNWGVATQTDYCTWHGVTCDATGHVTKL